MLDELQTKQIRRADLESRQPSVDSHSHDAEGLDLRLRQQLQQTGEIIDEVQLTVQPSIQENGDGEGVPVRDREEYEFRLFSKPAVGIKQENSRTLTQRIALRSPTPKNEGPSFVTSRRPNSFYFTGPSSPRQAKVYVESAVSGEEVLRGLDIRYTGAELPWRVTIVKSESKSRVMSTHVSNKPAIGRRVRNGKKRRIMIRKRAAAEREKQTVVPRAQIEKDEAEKEKRTRRNREKKVKKRQKDKAKKAQNAQIP